MFGFEFCTKKLPSAYVYLSPEWSWGLKRFPSLKYNNVQKWESRLRLGLDIAKNTHRIKESLNKSCSALNFVGNSLRAHISISLWSGAKGLERFPILKYNNVQKRESIGWGKSHASELHKVNTKLTLFNKNIMRNAGNDHHEHLCTDPSSRACCGTLDGELQLKYFRFLQ